MTSAIPTQSQGRCREGAQSVRRCVAPAVAQQPVADWAVRQPVRPRDQNSAPASIRHSIDGKRVDHIPVAAAVFAQGGADFYDDCALILVAQLDLLAGGPH